MGADKALLEIEGVPLAARVAARLKPAAGYVALIGSPGRYGTLGYPVIADLVGNCGPLGGVYTALSVTAAEWNLIVACDMPGVTAGLFEDLFRAAESSAADCVLPGPLDTLCAVYHRRCLAPAAEAINRKSFKMQEFVSNLQTLVRPVSDPASLANINTPDQWSAR